LADDYGAHEIYCSAGRRGVAVFASRNRGDAMKADRLLSALMLLQGHGRLTGRQLATRLEVSERTVHRDMEALSAAGVPVFALRGAQGGWQLAEGWQTSVPGLEEQELRALLMAQPPRVLGDLRLASAAERAMGKLMASLPAAMRQQAVSIRERLFIDVEGWRGSRENLSMLPIVQEAVWRDRQLQIRYVRGGRDTGGRDSASPGAPRAGASRETTGDGASRDGASRDGVNRDGVNRDGAERIIHPLGLVAKGSAWYLVANTADGFRTFRISRIECATILADACARPADFDLATHWKNSTTTYQDSLSRYVVTLRVEPRAAAWLKQWRSAWLAEPMGAADADGWITCRVQFDCEDEACYVVLGFGQRAEVLTPPTLRDRILAEADAIVSRLKASLV
jgi:predicted DNA-binding transcriptional regulator YafY